MRLRNGMMRLCLAARLENDAIAHALGYFLRYSLQLRRTDLPIPKADRIIRRAIIRQPFETLRLAVSSIAQYYPRSERLRSSRQNCVQLLQVQSALSGLKNWPAGNRAKSCCAVA